MGPITILRVVMALATTASAFMGGVADIVPRSYIESIPADKFANPNFNHSDWYQNHWIPNLITTLTTKGGGLGSSGVLKGNEGKVTKWPQEGDRHRVRYCHWYPPDRTRNHDMLDVAISIWMNKLKAPSRGNHHALEFVETKYDDSSPRTCLRKVDGKDDWEFDPDLPKNALCVLSQQGGARESMATAGFKYHPTLWCQNVVWIGDPEPISIAHELGHVLGMAHEQQRGDCARYIGYACDKVVGYDEALERAKQHGWTAYQMCNDMDVAHAVQFKGLSFIRGVVVDGPQATSTSIGRTITTSRA